METKAIASLEEEGGEEKGKLTKSITLPPSIANELIVLKVGDTKFTTTRQTMANVAGSWFQLTFAGDKMKGEPVLQPDGSYFIDRNAKCFQRILDYLRTLDLSFLARDLPLPISHVPKPTLRNECQWYGLNEAVRYIEDQVGRCKHCGTCVLDATSSLCLHKNAERSHLYPGSSIRYFNALGTRGYTKESK